MAPGTPRSTASVNDTSAGADRLSVLTLRFDVLDVLDDNPDWPVVTILVDGVDPFQGVAKDWRGFDPHQILGKQAPLQPIDGGRRVAVCTCSCGIAGCGVIAPVIVPSPDGRRVSWVDFRDYTGVFVSPACDQIDDEDDAQSRRWDLPDLHFDRMQYLAEVDRAAKDWSWETDRRKTARLVRAALTPMNVTLPPDLRFDWAEPPWQAEGVEISFRGRHDGSLLGQAGQVILRLTSSKADPVEAAADIVAQLVAMSPEMRASAFGYERPELEL
jgi:hypothetical protein